MRGLAKYKYMMKQLTHPPEGGWEDKVRTIRWKWREREMKMRWKWQWDESYLTRTRRGGTQTQREGENTNTWKPSPPRANPERGRKKKTEADGNGTRPAEGGKTEAPEPTYTSETYTYLGTRRAKPTWREEHAETHEIGDSGVKVQQFQQMMHSSNHAKSWLGSRPSVFKSTLGRLTWWTLELHAQISSVPKTIKRKNHQTCKHVLMP